MNLHPAAETIHAAVTTLHGQAKILMSGHPTLIQALTLRAETEVGPVTVDFTRHEQCMIVEVYPPQGKGKCRPFSAVPSLVEINNLLA